MTKIRDGIAVVGMSCLLPGSKTPQCYYQALLDNKCSIDDVDLPSISSTDFPDTVIPEIYSRLDSAFINTLYLVHQALLQSGYLNRSDVLHKTGLIMGARETCSPKMFDLFSPVYLNELETGIRKLIKNNGFSFEYDWEPKDNSPLNIFNFSGPALLAAQTLTLTGPSFALDAACASSLYSIKLASDYLQSGAADMMLAGGFLSGFKEEALQHYFASLGVAAKEGGSRPLDRKSSGMAAKDGGGVVVLKRLSDAKRDNDNILAVINGVGWRNESGKGKLILAPSKSGQSSIYKETFGELKSSGISPDDIDFIECHATGTPVGDSIELNMLDAFYEHHESQPLFGSVKGNIGHLLAGAGVAALIKVICSMQHGVIPATHNVTNPNSSRRGRFSEVNLVTSNTPWPHSDSQHHTRRAAINCFGFGGAHAHMVVSQFVSSANSSNDNVSDSTFFRPDSLPLALIGAGVQFGEYSGITQFALAMNQEVDASIGVNPCLRGIDRNPEIANRFLASEAFAPGVRCSEFEIDILKGGVGGESKGEALNKELLLLKVADQALENAGFRRGAGQRVGVIVAARQNLFQVQLFLEYYLPRWIEEALDRCSSQLDQDLRDELIQLARNAVLHCGNGGFDFVATGIGPVLASRISSAWGFTGPAMKICGLENGFVRSLELAEQMLRLDDLDAVVVASIDNDPALEGRVFAGKYAAELGININGPLIDDSAVALVLTSQAKAGAAGNHVHALISNIACSSDPNNFQVDMNDSCGTEQYGSQQASNSIAHGFSFSTSAALSLLKGLISVSSVNGPESSSKADSVLVTGVCFDGQCGRFTVNATTFNDGVRLGEISDDADSNTVSKGRTLIKKMTHRLPSIESVMLADDVAKRFSTAMLSAVNPVTNIVQPEVEANIAGHNESYLAYFYQRNCKMQNVYYQNQNLLSELIVNNLEMLTSLSGANDSVTSTNSELKLRS